MKVAKIHARRILDSRGNFTIETDVELENGRFGRAAVPAGTSTGANEAVSIDTSQAVINVNDKLSKEFIGFESDQEKLDQRMTELDGTENKSNLGANAILSVSLAYAKALANYQNIPLYKYIGDLAGNNEFILPVPLVNIINGGAHADFGTDFQEFMIVPIGASSFTQALEWSVKVFHQLKILLKQMGLSTAVGDEGGFVIKDGNDKALQYIQQAIQSAGFNLGQDISLALDVAASQLPKSSEELMNTLVKYCEQYPIISIEDGLSETDWAGWVKLTERLGDKIQLVGDDLLVTNIKFLKKAIQEKAGNAILIKPNQIGTLTETIEAVKLAKQNGWKVIISHRSGETEDTTIAHLAVGLAAGQIKTGSVSRTDRTCKYNELLRIEEELGDKAWHT